MRELLTRYVDEQTPEEAPPFEYVERAARGRKTRNRVTAAMVTAIVVAGGATLAVVDRPRADLDPVGPAGSPVTLDIRTGEVIPGLSDDGPPPDTFQYGTTVMKLAGELRIAWVAPDPGRPTVLAVQFPHDPTSSYYDCMPETVVRILSQDAKSVRIAAYHYRAAAGSTAGQQCYPQLINGDGRFIELDLGRALGVRTVYAGAAGKRVVR